MRLALEEARAAMLEGRSVQALSSVLGSRFFFWISGMLKRAVRTMSAFLRRGACGLHLGQSNRRCACTCGQRDEPFPEWHHAGRVARLCCVDTLEAHHVEESLLRHAPLRVCGL